MANSVDPDQTAPLGAVWSGSTLLVSMLKLVLDVSIYMQQMSSADDTFKCIFCSRQRFNKFFLQNFVNMYILYLALEAHMKELSLLQVFDGKQNIA